MSVKLYLFLICAVTLNVSADSSEVKIKVSDDCDDLISCVSAWISDFLLNDKQHEPPATQIKETNVLKTMGDILSDVSSFIVDTFKSISKDKSLVKNDLNKTVIGIQTFTVNDTEVKVTGTSEKVKILFLDTIGKHHKELNHTIKDGVVLGNKSDENNKRDDPKVTTDQNKTPAETRYIFTPGNFMAQAFNDLQLKKPDESIYKDIDRETSKNNTNVPEIDLDQYVVSINVTINPSKKTEHEVHVIPLNITNSTVNITSHKVQRDDYMFKNIDKQVTSNYKITYETPINVTYLDIKSIDESNVTELQGSLNETTKDVIDILKNLNLPVLQEIINSNISTITELQGTLNKTRNDVIDVLKNLKLPFLQKNKNSNISTITELQETLNDTTKDVIDLLNNLKLPFLQATKNSNTYPSKQSTKDHDNHFEHQDITHLEITTKGKYDLEDSASNQTRDDSFNGFKNQNIPYLKHESNLGESVNLNQTTNVEGESSSERNFTYIENEKNRHIDFTEDFISNKANDDVYDTENHFDIDPLMDTNISELGTLTQTKNNDIDSFDVQNPHENEIPAYDNFNYNIDSENGTDYLEIDYVSIYKDVTVEDVEYTPAVYRPTTSVPVTLDEVNNYNGMESIFPWIATVFVKSSTDQFEYICDGSLVSERVVLTAARCLMKSNVTEDAGNVLIILGKKSLQATGPNEKVIRVKQIKIHENFTNIEGNVDNDLAIVVLDEAVDFNDAIQPATLASNDDDDGDADQSATTGWHITGSLTPIYFIGETKQSCVKNTASNNTFCASFGNGITTCPSFGGLFVTRNKTDWRLQGISSGNPTSTGVCFDKIVTFTNIKTYFRWIMENVNLNKYY